MKTNEQNDEMNLQEDFDTKEVGVEDEITSDSNQEDLQTDNEIMEEHNLENGGDREVEDNIEPIVEMDADEVVHTTILIHLGWGENVLQEIEGLLSADDYQLLIELLHSPMGPHFWNEDFQELIGHLNLKLAALQTEEEEV